MARALVWHATGRKWLPPRAWLAAFAAALLVALAMNLTAFLYLLPIALLEWCVIAPYQEEEEKTPALSLGLGSAH